MKIYEKQPSRPASHPASHADVNIDASRIADSWKQAKVSIKAAGRSIGASQVLDLSHARSTKTLSKSMKNHVKPAQPARQPASQPATSWKSVEICARNYLTNQQKCPMCFSIACFFIDMKFISKILKNSLQGSS